MSYQKYTTDALVVGSMPRGEADKTLMLYTRDFGLVRALAKGMREERSRLRHALQDLSLVRVSLISGKGGWRVAGVSLYESWSRRGISGACSLARVMSLLQKLVQGEEQNNYLYETLAGAHFALKGREDVRDEVETLCVLRLLYALGYIAPHTGDEGLFQDSLYDISALARVRTRRKEFVKIINSSFAESQLLGQKS